MGARASTTATRGPADWKSAKRPPTRTAGFPTCGIADFLIGRASVLPDPRVRFVTCVGGHSAFSLICIYKVLMFSWLKLIYNVVYLRSGGTDAIYNVAKGVANLAVPTGAKWGRLWGVV